MSLSVVLPQQLSEWKVVEQIKSKRGQMYEVTHIPGGTTRVLRVVPIPVTEYGMSPMVLRELMSTSIHHPNIVRTYQIVNQDSVLYMITEAASGNLKHFCKVVPLQDVDARQRVAIDVANGVAALHSFGYVHRRLTAHNVLIFGKYKAKLGDLQHLQCSEVSLAYTAPEVLVGGDFTEASDVWSLGCLLHLIKYNSLPFEPSQQAWFASTTHEESMLKGICLVLGTPPLELRDKYNLKEPCIGSTVDDPVIRACLQWDPAKRLTAADVVHKLGGHVVKCPTSKSVKTMKCPTLAKEVCDDIVKLAKHKVDPDVLNAAKQLFATVIHKLRPSEPLNYSRYYDVFGACYVIAAKVLTDEAPEKIYGDAMGALNVPDKRLVYVPLERQVLDAIGWHVPPMAHRAHTAKTSKNRRHE